MSTVELIAKSRENKPRLGSPCNHCGWCCLTQVCEVGVQIQGLDNNWGPCRLLEYHDGKHLCGLAVRNVTGVKAVLAMGEGCDAISIEEKIQAIEERDMEILNQLDPKLLTLLPKGA